MSSNDVEPCREVGGRGRGDGKGEREELNEFENETLSSSSVILDSVLRDETVRLSDIDADDLDERPERDDGFRLRHTSRSRLA